MSAIIRSILNGNPLSEVIGLSREDLRSADLVTCNSVDAHTTYLWSLDFTPNDAEGNPSSATLTSISTAVTSFTADNEGPYLLRLTVDAGLATEDTQTVRLRALTVFGQLQLVAAGEKNDTTGQIPVDVDTKGWAHEQNQNLQRLLRFTESVSSSGRLLYVDANRGTDYSNPQNDPSIAEGYADYSSIQDAINAALADAVPPSLDDPYVIRIRPGLYIEDITIAPFVYLRGLSNSLVFAEERSVVIRPSTSGASIIASSAGASDVSLISGLVFENTDNANTNGTVHKTGPGQVYINQCCILQNADTTAPALLIDQGTVYTYNARIESLSTLNPTDPACTVDGASTFLISRASTFIGPSVLLLNPNELANSFATLIRTSIENTSFDPSAFGVRSDAVSLNMERCDVLSGTQSLDIHPSAGVSALDIAVSLKWCQFTGDINFDTTGVGGTTSLGIGSVSYQNLNITGALTTGPVADIQSQSLFFDNTATTLSSEDVQGAIVELASAAGGTVNIQDEGVAVGAFGTLNFVGSPVTATPGLPGVVDVTITGTGSSAPTLVTREIPTGAVDGVNTIFTLASATVLAGSEEVFLNGALQDDSAGDYTFVGPSTIDFAVSAAPLPGDIIRVNYQDISIPSTNSFVTREIPAGAIDGINTVFTLSNPAIVLGSEQVFLNGILQDDVAGDYNFVGPNQVDFVPSGAPSPGDIIRVTYQIP